jgi:hypothetical protein
VLLRKNFTPSRNVSNLHSEERRSVIKTVLFNHEITKTFDVGALITLQKLTLFSYFLMIKIDTENKTTLLKMLIPVAVLCATTSCSLVDFQECFGLEYRLHWRERQKRKIFQDFGAHTSEHSESPNTRPQGKN